MSGLRDELAAALRAMHQMHPADGDGLWGLVISDDDALILTDAVLAHPQIARALRIAEDIKRLRDEKPVRVGSSSVGHYYSPSYLLAALGLEVGT